MKNLTPLAATLALAACASSSTTGGASSSSTPAPSATVATSAPTSACDSLRAKATPTANVAPAQPLPGNPRPPYPNDAGMTAQFVVKPDGKVDMSTFKVVQSDHEAFTTSVRNTLSDWRFRAAEIAPGCRIAHLETMPFDFTTR